MREEQKGRRAPKVGALTRASVERGPKGLSGIRTNNAAEVRVLGQLEDQGYRVLKRGWPDFIAIRGDEVRLIEVKPGHQSQLGPRQQEVADALAKLGVTVELAAGNLQGFEVTPRGY